MGGRLLAMGPSQNRVERVYGKRKDHVNYTFDASRSPHVVMQRGLVR